MRLVTELMRLKVYQAINNFLLTLLFFCFDAFGHKTVSPRRSQTPSTLHEKALDKLHEEVLGQQELEIKAIFVLFFLITEWKSHWACVQLGI